MYDYLWGGMNIQARDMWVIEMDGKDEELIEVEVGDYQPEPKCEQGDAHQWESPVDVVGGIDSNPGVWSYGGTTIGTSMVCVRCGMYRHSIDYGTQRNPSDCDTVEYLPADNVSLRHVQLRPI